MTDVDAAGLAWNGPTGISNQFAASIQEGEGSAEAGAGAKRRLGVSGRGANQNPARFFEVRRSLFGVFAGKGIPAERPRAVHPRSGPSADGGDGL